jgi:hypothetical protein
MSKFFKSLVTDGQWDGDATKVIGIIIVAAGIIGYFFGKDPLVMLAFGGGLIATGKFSPQG